MRGSVNGLPASQPRVEIGPRHPRFVPHVEVPDGVVPLLQVIAPDVDVLVDRHVVIGVVRRGEVGHAASGNPQAPQHGGEHARKHPTLTIPGIAKQTIDLQDYFDMFDVSIVIFGILTFEKVSEKKLAFATFTRLVWSNRQYKVILEVILHMNNSAKSRN